jgi:hypothetical protein
VIQLTRAQRAELRRANRRRVWGPRASIALRLAALAFVFTAGVAFIAFAAGCIFGSGAISITVH